jgi:hypothetical protein
VCLPTRLLAAGGENCNSSFFFLTYGVV